jgi:dTDP-4-dehydrorhamnose 3,5-epimerase
VLRELHEFGGPLVFFPIRHEDHRGSYMETFNQTRFQELTGANGMFVVDTHSISIRRNVVRGLHFQYPPKDKEKIVRVSRGAILDIIVDIRKGSKTFGDHAANELSADNLKQLYIPAGFAHGYRTLIEETEVQYKSSSYFESNFSAGINWDDPRIEIDWGISCNAVLLSEYDMGLPKLADIDARLEAARQKWAVPGFMSQELPLPSQGKTSIGPTRSS